MAHQSLTDELRDSMTLYVLDMLGPAETQAIAAHLEAGCTLCTEELQAVERVVGLLGYNASAVQPPPEIRARLLTSLTLEVAQSVRTAPQPSGLEAGFFYLRAHEGHWHELSPGVLVKTEELFVLQGDCHIAPAQVLQAGDYFRAEAGSVHGTTFTAAGTTFLTLCWNAFPA